MEFELTFDKLTVDERQALLAAGERVTFDPDTVLVREGDSLDALYVVMKGTVRVERTVRVRARIVAGAEATAAQRAEVEEPRAVVELARLGEGALLGEISLLLEEHRATANVVAAEHIAAVRIPAAKLAAMLDENPDLRSRFYFSIARTLARRLKATSKRIGADW